MTRARRASFVVAFAALTLTALGSGARAEKLGVGLFAPELSFANPGERYSLVSRLAQHLASSLGVEVEGRAYKTAGDMERDVKAKRIHFAVLGAVYLASRKVPVVAQARVTSTRWTLMAKEKTTLAALAGKVLQIPRLGPLATRFVENGLLGGNVVLAKHFKVALTPDLYSAVATVRLGRAAAVFAPSSTKGLVPVIAGISMPPPGFAVVGKVDAGVRAKATQAVLGFGAAMGGIQGWQRGSARAYAAIAGASQKKVNNMMLSAAKVERLRDDELINLEQLRPELPTMENLFWLP